MGIAFRKEIEIPLQGIQLKGDLTIPEDAEAMVVFSHGSGSSRFSPRNRQVATYLNQHKLGTLLIDLLTEDEDTLYANRFDISLLTKRLAGATEFLKELVITQDLHIGYFGASTGAASALRAAAILPYICAVVSRGGRPDLAMEALPKVNAPTLLIVGSLDYTVIELNREAYKVMTCTKSMEIIDGASHLFEEKGTLDKVAEAATHWFQKYLTTAKVAHQ
ncbi:MAG: dienelactone hydrolase family protein [Bacteroidetes bacterium]|nr:dienelactone hydrolase family protein [Bacteroidota bacterium]